MGSLLDLAFDEETSAWELAATGVGRNDGTGHLHETLIEAAAPTH